MRLSDLGEFGFIRRISSGCIVDPARVVMGIGDDCAVTLGHEGSLDLVTTDLLIEHVHFCVDNTTGYQLGKKSIAASLSDIAAMGGAPLDAVVSVAIPKHIDIGFLDDLYRGLKDMAGGHGVNIIGGDTSRAVHDLVVSITMTGVVPEDQILYRGGAHPGDAIFVTGPLGDAAGGLHAVINRDDQADENTAMLVRRYLEPVPHLKQGQTIAATRLARAMIDVSDGLSADLMHICSQSGVGCVIEEEKLPFSAELIAYCQKSELDPMALALHGGEDYVLLCTGDGELGASLSALGVDVTEIGSVSTEMKRFIRRDDGTHRSLESRGWDHFSGKR